MKYVASLDSGTVFGEKGLNDIAKRNATIISTADTHLAFLSKVDYNYVLKDASRFEVEKQISFLSKIAFPQITDSVLLSKLSYDLFKFEKHYMRKDTIFRQGMDSDFIYVIKKGRVLLFREERVIKKPFKHLVVTSRKAYHRLCIGMLGPGSVFGEDLVMANNLKRIYTSVCATECQILRASNETIRNHMENFPSLKEILSASYNKKIQRRDQLLVNQLEIQKESISSANQFNSTGGFSYKDSRKDTECIINGRIIEEEASINLENGFRTLYLQSQSVSRLRHTKRNLHLSSSQRMLDKEPILNPFIVRAKKELSLRKKLGLRMSRKTNRSNISEEQLASNRIFIDSLVSRVEGEKTSLSRRRRPSKSVVHESISKIFMPKRKKSKNNKPPRSKDLTRIITFIKQRLTPLLPAPLPCISAAGSSLRVSSNVRMHGSGLSSGILLKRGGNSPQGGIRCPSPLRGLLSIEKSKKSAIRRKFF